MQGLNHPQNPTRASTGRAHPKQGSWPSEGYFSTCRPGVPPQVGMALEKVGARIGVRPPLHPIGEQVNGAELVFACQRGWLVTLSATFSLAPKVIKGVHLNFVDHLDHL